MPSGDMRRGRRQYMSLELREPVKMDGFRSHPKPHRPQLPSGDMRRGRWQYMSLKLREPVKNDGIGKSFLLRPERECIRHYREWRRYRREKRAGSSRTAQSRSPNRRTGIAGGRRERAAGGCGLGLTAAFACCLMKPIRLPQKPGSKEPRRQPAARHVSGDVRRDDSLYGASHAARTARCRGCAER